MAAIHDLETLAPLHNGPSLAGIDRYCAITGTPEERATIECLDCVSVPSAPDAGSAWGVPRLPRAAGLRRPTPASVGA